MEHNAKRVQDYKELVARLTPRSRLLQGCLRAFWVGGLICALGQFFTGVAVRLQLSELTAPMFTSVVLIFLGILGEYILSMNKRIMNRPLVVEQERLNFDEEETEE